MKPARAEEGVIAESQDLGEEDQEDKGAEHRGNADVRDPAGPRRRRRRPAPQAATERDPVERRVERHEEEVVGHDRPEEPHKDVHNRGPREAGEPSRDGGTGDQQGRDEREEVEGTLTVEPAEPNHYALSNVILWTHLVQWTPGIPGPMRRAGNPWSRDRSTPFTLSASNKR